MQKIMLNGTKKKSFRLIKHRVLPEALVLASIVFV